MNASPLHTIAAPHAAAAPPTPDTAESPARRTTDDDLRAQQARILRLCAVPLMFLGILWSAIVAFSALEDDVLLAVENITPGLLSVVGYLTFSFARRGNVRAGAYTIAAALVANGSISLIFITNAQFTAVVCYCVALSIAAIVIPAREQLIFGSAMIAVALVSALLNSFPLTPQSTLPDNLVTLATIIGVVPGLPYPMAMFWLFSRNLERSRADAWSATGDAKAAMREAQESRKQLARLAEQLHHKNTELGDFLYVVSHDMRAPLINLEGFSRALDENLRALLREMDTRNLRGSRRARIDEIVEGIDESLDFILRSVSKADLLVNTVLELSRIETRHERLVPVDLSQVVAEVANSLEFRLRELGGSIEADPLPVVNGDPVRIHQVFANLLDNAVKYARRDVPLRIEVRHADHSDGHLFAVVDNGVGIRNEDVGKIFRMFGRLGHTREPGDGIGLTIVKKIIERRRGQIWVESTPGVGSTFYFTWPDEWPDSADRPSATEEQREDAAA
jgi:signal transduction histidine kinase